MSHIANLFSFETESNSIDYHQVLENLDLQTGDVLLMGTKTFWFSRLVEKVTGSKWSHVGIVLKDPTWINPSLTGYYFWQSGTENFPDSENDQKKFGVRIDDLEEILSDYDGYVSVRRLQLKEPIPNLEEKLKEIHEVVHGKTYDLDILDFLNAREEVETSSGWFSKYSKKTSSFFCSALAAYIYSHLGLLPKDTEWTKCEPKTFSDQNTDLKLEMNAELRPEYPIKPLKRIKK